MQVFISFSGSHSRAVAQALYEWLPLVINNVRPFVSERDIYAGARWQAELATQLKDTHFGLICVTRDNQAAPWLNFEAGALAKAVETSRVVPIAIDLRPAEVADPLGQFQGQPATRDGISKVVTSLNNALESSLSDAQLDRAFEALWPNLELQLEEIASRESAAAGTSTPARSEREILEEVLTEVRALSRTLAASADPQTSQVDLIRLLGQQDMLRTAERRAEEVRDTYAMQRMLDRIKEILDAEGLTAELIGRTAERTAVVQYVRPRPLPESIRAAIMAIAAASEFAIQIQDD